MHDIAAFAGRLAGTALNPVIWGVTILVLALTKEWRYAARILSAVAATVLIGAVLYAFDNYLTLGEKIRGLIFAAIVSAIIASAWVAMRRPR